VSTGLPALSEENSSRDRANPGTWVSRHPTSEEHLVSHRGPGTRSPRHRLIKPLAGGPPVASSSRPYASQLGRPDAQATPTEQVRRAYPSHPTLLSVGGCKWGSTPLSSYTTPTAMPREEGASSFSRTGGTAGWLLNLRPGTRGMVAYDGPAGQRAGCPGPRLSASRPLERSLLCVANHLTSYTALLLPASPHGGPRTLLSMRPTELAPWAGAQL
jgi:hypothetical protein